MKGKLLLSVVAACVLAMPSSNAFGSLGINDAHRKLKVGSVTRRYDVHVPPKYEGQQSPVIIALHGGLGSPLTAKVDIGLTERADELGIITVYPQGTGQVGRMWSVWNAGACCGRASDENVDDVAFIKELISQLRKDYNVDPSRIYVVGCSNGGMLAYRLACEMPDTLAAIASVEGAVVSPLVPPNQPVSVVAIHGTKDSVLPYDGGTGALLWYKIHCYPIDDVVKFWAKADECAQSPTVTTAGDVTYETYSGGRQGSEVQLITFDGGGHTWPASIWLFGKKPPQWSTADVVCDFLMKHPKQPAPILQ